MKINHAIPLPRRLRSRQKVDTSGFSLIELLTVVAILGIVLALSVSAFQRAAQGSPLGNALSGITAGLELARQTAITQNTYTWVRLGGVEEKGASGNVVAMAIYASKNGDLQNTSGSGGASENYDLISRVQTFPGVALGTKSDLSASSAKRRLPLSNSTARVAVPNDSIDSRLKTVELPHDARSLFSKAAGNTGVIMFTPRGEAAVDRNEKSGSAIPLYQALEVVLLPQRGSAPSNEERKAAAAIWVNGITGLSTVYQPELDRR